MLQKPAVAAAGCCLDLELDRKQFCHAAAAGARFCGQRRCLYPGHPRSAGGEQRVRSPGRQPAAAGRFLQPSGVRERARGWRARRHFLHRQAGNDRTVLMQGGAFTTFTNNNAGKDTRLWSTDANGTVYQPQILRVTNQALAALMSPPSSTYGMYLTWAENANGVGYPVRVNGTDAWWIGPNHAIAGSSVNVYGRNLSYQNGTTTS